MKPDIPMVFNEDELAILIEAVGNYLDKSDFDNEVAALDNRVVEAYNAIRSQ